ncbi:uncharacterized protein BJ171DRAFT_568492 [Polychytrium aggregatum]|uniref:uncharacterized protein n=1 Tax=Polychytrium aggregatum TaxID=110093 RepID=UPI0022FDFE7E|nr:uncharacterized protein BJ171DRAFT_568492 [Polychytrium aggregatum]KAI9204030.1 hypothetical protein BJ171DRAFT_568492 [Polychytrium aggregatum]
MAPTLDPVTACIHNPHLLLLICSSLDASDAATLLRCTSGTRAVSKTSSFRSRCLQILTKQLYRFSWPKRLSVSSTKGSAALPPIQLMLLLRGLQLRVLDMDVVLELEQQGSIFPARSFVPDPVNSKHGSLYMDIQLALTLWDRAPLELIDWFVARNLLPQVGLFVRQTYIKGRKEAALLALQRSQTANPAHRRLSVGDVVYGDPHLNQWLFDEVLPSDDLTALTFLSGALGMRNLDPILPHVVLCNARQCLHWLLETNKWSLKYGVSGVIVEALVDAPNGLSILQELVAWGLDIHANAEHLLREASRCGRVHMVELLINLGCNPEAAPADAGDTDSADLLDADDDSLDGITTDDESHWDEHDCPVLHIETTDSDCETEISDTLGSPPTPRFLGSRRASRSLSAKTSHSSMPSDAISQMAATFGLAFQFSYLGPRWPRGCALDIAATDEIRLVLEASRRNHSRRRSSITSVASWGEVFGFS